MFYFTVIDDEATTVYTAGAIVTVTVNLIRRDMSCLFGDETVKEETIEEIEPKEEKESQNVVKKPVWQKQIKKKNNVKNKKKDTKKVYKAPVVAPPPVVAQKGAGENGNVVSNHVNASVKENHFKDKEKDSDSESELSDEEDRSDNENSTDDQDNKKVNFDKFGLKNYLLH